MIRHVLCVDVQEWKENAPACASLAGARPVLPAHKPAIDHQIHAGAE